MYWTLELASYLEVTHLGQPTKDELDRLRDSIRCAARGC